MRTRVDDPGDGIPPAPAISGSASNWMGESSEWITVEILGAKANYHRDDLVPCGECGAVIFDVWLVLHPSGRTSHGATIYRGELSIECPRCPPVNLKCTRRLRRRQQRSKAAQFDMRSHTLHGLPQGHIR